MGIREPLSPPGWVPGSNWPYLPSVSQEAGRTLGWEQGGMGALEVWAGT